VVVTTTLFRFPVSVGVEQASPVPVIAWVALGNALAAP